MVIIIKVEQRARSLTFGENRLMQTLTWCKYFVEKQDKDARTVKQHLHVDDALKSGCPLVAISMSPCQMSAQGVSLDSWVDLGMLQTEKQLLQCFILQGCILI